MQAATRRAIRDFSLGEPQPAETPAWKTLPSWSVFGSGDKNIAAEGLRFMAERAGGLRVQEIEAPPTRSWCPTPPRVGDLIVEAVQHLA